MPVQKSKKSAKPSVKPKAKPAAKSPVKKANVKVAAKPVKRASPAGKLEKSKKVVISVKASGRSPAPGKAPVKPVKSPKKVVSVPSKTPAPATKVATKPVAKPAAKTAAKTTAKPVAKPPVKTVAKPLTKAVAKPTAKAAAKPAVKTAAKPLAKPAAKPASKAATAKPADSKAASAKALAEEQAKKKPGRPAKNTAGDSAPAVTGAKRGRKPKAGAKTLGDEDMSDIEDDLAGEPVPESAEKVKPLRMKISKAKERALMKEFGLEETVLSEEDMAKRRLRLKTLIKLDDVLHRIVSTEYSAVTKPDVYLTYTKRTKTLKIQLSQELGGTKKSKTEGTRRNFVWDGSTEMNFLITAYNDPNILYKTHVITINDLIGKTVTVKNIDVGQFSVYTRRLFKNYVIEYK
jgi:hypothetical protein